MVNQLAPPDGNMLAARSGRSSALEETVYVEPKKPLLSQTRVGWCCLCGPGLALLALFIGFPFLSYLARVLMEGHILPSGADVLGLVGDRALAAVGSADARRRSGGHRHFEQGQAMTAEKMKKPPVQRLGLRVGTVAGSRCAKSPERSPVCGSAMETSWMKMAAPCTRLAKSTVFAICSLACFWSSGLTSQAKSTLQITAPSKRSLKYTVP